jgi:protein-L-isoaspartate(D-aspartate) O-methyltransferase
VPSQKENEGFELQRERMVRVDLRGRGIRNPEVLERMREVPRENFLLKGHRRMAYNDCALPYLEGQTVSQPYIVALMTELVAPGLDDTVLEVGTGSGYQTAVLAGMCRMVHSIERLETLHRAASMNLERLDLSNVELHHRDGWLGLPEHAPYQAILVTCAADTVPPALVEQLDEEGRLVIPIGNPRSPQQLMRYTKREGELVLHNAGGVIFVPFVRGIPPSQ